MRIVITGGMGFIGKNLAIYMRRQGYTHTLHCVDWMASPPQSDKDLYNSVCSYDFASSEAKHVYSGADVVIHLAATTTVQESIENPSRTFENNVVKSHYLLEHLRTSVPHAHFIFASTGGAIIGDHNGPIDETIPPRPVSPYGASKLAVEGLLNAYSSSFNLPTTALRFSNVYGPNSDRKTSVIAAFCKAYLQTGVLTINGDGKQTRDYVFVDDICQAICKTIDTRATGPFQLGTGVATSILDLVKTIQTLDPLKKVELEHAPRLLGEVAHNVCDISHAFQTLGYNPKYTLARGIAETLGWFQNYAAIHQSYAERQRA